MNFVDTGAFLALHLKNDQFHETVLRIWPKLGRAVTSGHVMDELATLLARRASYNFAADCLGYLYDVAEVEIVQSTREDEIEALHWMRKFADQGVSFTDGVSFSIMRRKRIRRALTFDRHFQLAGFRIVAWEAPLA